MERGECSIWVADIGNYDKVLVGLARYIGQGNSMGR